MRYANIIVPFGSDNTTAIDFIVTNLKSKIKENELKSLRRAVGGANVMASSDQLTSSTASISLDGLKEEQLSVSTTVV